MSWFDYHHYHVVLLLATHNDKQSLVAQTMGWAEFSRQINTLSHFLWDLRFWHWYDPIWFNTSQVESWELNATDVTATWLYLPTAYGKRYVKLSDCWSTESLESQSQSKKRKILSKVTQKQKHSTRATYGLIGPALPCTGASRCTFEFWIESA